MFIYANERGILKNYGKFSDVSAEFYLYNHMNGIQQNFVCAK